MSVLTTLRSISLLLLLVLASLIATTTAVAGDHEPVAKPNLLIITVDDMSCDSVGAFGCELEGTTPNIDRLASQGLRYEFAHVQVGNCMPSRNVMFSGLYPHNTGMEGFYQIKQPKHPMMADLMKAHGYFVAIRGKVSHSTPYHPYPAWDTDLTTLDGVKQDMKNAESYYASTKAGIEMAESENKPFCINVNISDPHKPFYATGKKGETIPDKNVPTRVFTADEVPVPGFLFDDPAVRRELAQYYSSVRRADDCFAATMKALKESGQEDNTVVIFLSDHGMPLPFAKTALYHHSTRTPWIVRWPGVTKAGTVDRDHMISAVDLLPTLLEIVGAPPLERSDGRSFLPTIRGEQQEGRDAIFKVYNENSGSRRHPMRGVQTKQFGYLFNPWSDGENKFATATTGTVTYRKMVELAKTDAKIAERLSLFDHRAVEEFYDYKNDPDGLNNLIDDPAYADIIQQHREKLHSLMSESGDHALDVFMNRNDPAARLAYVKKVQDEATARRAKRKGQSKNQQQAKKKQNKYLFKLKLPETVSVKNDVVIEIQHKLPKSLGQQLFHVTLKNAKGNRIERKVVSGVGNDKLQVSFRLPSDYSDKAIVVSAFVGEEYQKNLLHVTEGPIPVK